ncbi:MAG TPA: PEP-CTERM sorting domain-containing protein [Burkholderiaceae bacterium]
MILRSIALAAIAATSIGAQAALVTYAPWDTAYASHGLAGVLFDVNTANGVTVALGAHAYKNGVSLPNDGANTFYAQNGIYAPDGKGYANWSFDFGFDLGSCAGCKVFIGIDKDPSAGVNLVYGDITNHLPNPESWNMKMSFITAGVYNFDPYSASSTAFALEVRDSSGIVLDHSNITVNVPEPGSLALVGLALAGVAAVRRRKA